jgi:transglutaminase-like putative cysteine protease
MAEALPLPQPLRRWALLAAFACALPLLALVPFWLEAPLLVAAGVAFWSERQWPSWLRFALVVMLGGLVIAGFGFRVGRDTASAGLLALLMLKPFETRSRRDAHALLGFSLFAPFAAFLQDQGPLTWSLALPAMAVSLMSWAMLLPGASTLAWPGLRRAGFAALLATPVALAGFWLFPRLPAPMWGLPENAISHRGLGDRMTPNEWLDALVDDSPAMRARFSGRTPPRAQMYWRGPVLVNYDGQAWTRDPGGGAVAAPAEALSQPIEYEVMLEPTERFDLLLLDIPLEAPPGSALNGEFTAVSSSALNNLSRYRGRSASSARFGQQLQGWQRRQALQLPYGRDPRTRALAAQWARETPDPIALTNRFLAMLRRDFKYTISAPPVGYHATDDFLFSTRRGFCQHFSSAYAVFMRSAGVPARVVTGYVGGHYNSLGDYWLLKHKDAHAWTEIWIEGRGWVRVDPTAAIAPENILDTLDDVQGAQQGLGDVFGGAAPMLGSMLDGADFLRRQWNELVLGFNAQKQKGLLKPFGVDDADAWQLVVAFAIGSGLALLATLWFLLHEHRDRSPPLLRAWRAFVARLRRAGIDKRAEEPPLSFGRRAAALLPAQSERLLSVSGRYADWRYAGLALTDEEQRGLARELRGFRIQAHRHVRRNP